MQYFVISYHVTLPNERKQRYLIYIIQLCNYSILNNAIIMLILVYLNFQVENFLFQESWIAPVLDFLLLLLVYLIF